MTMASVFQVKMWAFTLFRIKLGAAPFRVSLCHNPTIMSHDVREEVRDWLFKAAINWKLPRGETQKLFL